MEGTSTLSILMSEIREMSDARRAKWKVVTAEWVVEGHAVGVRDTCLCTYHPIRENYFIRNRHTGRTAIVGSRCVEQFLNGEDPAVYLGHAIDAGKDEVGRGGMATPALLYHAWRGSVEKAGGMLSDEEHAFYVGVCFDEDFDLPAEQRMRRNEINAKLREHYGMAAARGLADARHARPAPTMVAPAAAVARAALGVARRVPARARSLECAAATPAAAAAATPGTRDAHSDSDGDTALGESTHDVSNSGAGTPAAAAAFAPTADDGGACVRQLDAHFTAVSSGGGASDGAAAAAVVAVAGVVAPPLCGLRCAAESSDSSRASSSRASSGNDSDSSDSSAPAARPAWKRLRRLSRASSASD
jgi:hypothetical protein